MRIPIKALCEEKRTKCDGTSWIFFQYFHDGIHRIFLNTEIAIPSSYWDKQREYIKASLPEEFSSHVNLNKEVNRQLKLASDLILLAKAQKISELGKYIKEKFSQLKVFVMSANRLPDPAGKDLHEYQQPRC